MIRSARLKLSVLFANIILLSGMMVGLTAITPWQTASAAGGCNDTFLTFPAWYKGMQDTKANGCGFQPKKDAGGRVDFKTTTIAIVLNVVNIILQLVGYASAIMIIVGGFNYMTSNGEANKMSSAKSTIQNAIIGLIISILSVAIVNLVAGVL